MTQVLLVDDDPHLRRAMALNLGAHDYDVVTAIDGASALAAATRSQPDVVIVDLGLPDMDGTELVREIRRLWQVPVIVLSAREGEQHKVAALDAGADDYVTKPYGMPEFLARVRAALRRAAPAAEVGVVKAAGFTVDLGSKRVLTPAGEVKLTATEWHVLAALARRPGTLVTQRQLLREVWGPEYGHETNYLRIYLAQLRRKLEPEPSQPRHLITEHGKGYRFEP